MALLLRDREAAPEAASPSPNGGSPAGATEHTCEVCGGTMKRGQDWCLECGTAAPGRLGARPGWRAAFTIVGLTLLLVCGAVLASYAALTSDAERTASAPTAGNGNPVVAAPAPAAPVVPSAPIQPGATGPGTTPPAVTPGPTAVAPGTGPQTSPHPVIPTPHPVIPPSTGAVPPAAGTAKAPATVPPTGAKQPEAQQSATANLTPQVIALKSDAAQTYDPAKRAGAEFGPADNAIDRKLGTVWDVTVPADGNPIGAGLLVDMGTPYALQSLRIATDTPGFRVELYGAVGKEVPVDVLDKRWQHLTDAKHVGSGEPINLKGKGDAPKYRQFLVYVTAPAQPTDPRVAISELQLRGTP